MERIRDLTYIWAQKTYGEMLSEFGGDTEINERLRDVLQQLNILGSRVVGQSITGLEKTSEVPLRQGISYSLAFEKALECDENRTRLPVAYLRNLVFHLQGKDFAKTKGTIARGLRTLPSLLRDRDFAEKLREHIGSRLPSGDFEIETGSGKDTKEHTDVYLIIRDKTFRIWLYQFTPRGLPHDVERVLGRRGILPSGLHVLCPLRTDVMMAREELEGRKRRLESKITKCGVKLKKPLGDDERRKILEEKSSAEKELEEIGPRLEAIKKRAEEEIVSVNGWYFYSDSKISRLVDLVLSVLSGSVTPDPYRSVCETLVGPEKYLGEIRIFENND